MLVPGDVGQAVVGPADGAGQADHGQRGLEDVRVVRVAVQRLAQLGHGGVAVAHDGAVQLLDRRRGGPAGGLQVDGGGAEAGVQVRLVALERGEHHLGAHRAVPVALEHGEDEAQHVVDEVLEQGPVAVLDLDRRLLLLLLLRGRRRRRRAEVEDVHAERGIVVLLGQRVEDVLARGRREQVLGHPVGGGGQRAEAAGGRGLEGAEGADGRVAAQRHVVDEHLALGLDVDGVGRGLAGEGGVGEMVGVGEGGVVVGEVRLERRRVERGVVVVEVEGGLERGAEVEVGARVLGRGARAAGRVRVRGRRGQRVREGGQRRRGRPAEAGVVVRVHAGVVGVGDVRVRVHVLGLLGELGVLDGVLDLVLLQLALLVVAPPQRPLVLAGQAQVLARATAWLALVALLPP